MRIAHKNRRVILLDNSEGMLEIAARKMNEGNLRKNVTIAKGDMIKTPFVNEVFDTVFCEQAFFLVSKPDAFLREMHRILKENARLIISAQNLFVQCLASLSENPDKANLDTVLKILTRRNYATMTKGGEVKIYTWSPSEFRMMLARNGFCVEKIVGKGITRPLRISKDVFTRSDYDEMLFKKILECELALCEDMDALALAGHVQAIARKENR